MGLHFKVGNVSHAEQFKGCSVHLTEQTDQPRPTIFPKCFLSMLVCLLINYIYVSFFLSFFLFIEGNNLNMDGVSYDLLVCACVCSFT